MNDPYIIALIGVGGTVLGVLVGSFLQGHFRKNEIKRIEKFQKDLADQNEALQKQHHEDEMMKITTLGQILTDISHSLKK